MTKNNIILTITLLSLSIGLLYFLTKKSEGKTEIYVKETKKTYSFGASFNPTKMPRITSYLNNYLASEGGFNISQNFDEEIVLKDKTTFQLETSAGEITITADKRNNAVLSIERIRKMGLEIKDLIAQ
ncbi:MULTISPECIES: hypothetical protein [unclassified Arcicella]|uniref:hypothetical protein n=1 Tax=unclassified Arcicella TaxID=2644986 RepID=UPI0028564E86|nr:MULTISPECIES: hypothetical protein [unclassified Arcicella]MDR6564398.1 hypothetical protein [Arcicella sp. BE51]MDR6814147.1 hypothetical protein [Arcicella sp. BE140]MDR6825459.1 hypothetical protein [Arcicella sp. BE139]